jgi:hypothetical protein
MLPPNSSISNFSSNPVLSSAKPFSWADFRATAMYFFFFLLFFEIAIWAAFTQTRLAQSSLRQYLWYGTSYEAKLREIVNTPNLPSNSIFNAGWLGDGKLFAQPNDVDVTVYGMSFSGNLSDALRKLRPKMTQRIVLGPGAPLSHSYAAYQIDKKLRSTHFAIIGVTSGGVQEVLLMNRGTLYSDAAFPYFFPRYKMDGDRVAVQADSLINSADQLSKALSDPVLWERQLAVLSENDPAYRRFFFARDLFDYSVLGRLARRALSKRHAAQYSGEVFGRRGFNPQSEAASLFRGILQQMIVEMRAENVEPILALFSLQGQGNYLFDLVDDILSKEHVAYMNSFEFCRSDAKENYQRDMHFVETCNLKFGRRTLELMDHFDAVHPR